MPPLTLLTQKKQRLTFLRFIVRINYVLSANPSIPSIFLKYLDSIY